jgi:hypothetical protein
MRTRVSTATQKKQFIRQLRARHGIITLACSDVGITRQCYYKWMKNDPKFKEECEIIDEEGIDFVENKLMARINDHDTTAIIFYLKTKGKKRGYVEQIEQRVDISPFDELMKMASQVDEE